MPSLEVLCGELARIAPLRLAESWDNVGLLVGDRKQTVSRVMTCLTITPNVVDEAVNEKVDLIVAHHPLPFKGLQKITSDTVTGGMLLQLIASGTAIYSAHTAFDSAANGINQMWADSLGLTDVEPLILMGDSLAEGTAAGTGDGSGRVGKLAEPISLGALVAQVSKQVGASAPRCVGDQEQSVRKVAFACGSGGAFLSAAKRHGCDALITGEATFHTCLEAESTGIGLGLLGHYWSERFAMERLAETLSGTLPSLTIWPSRSEHDPIVPVNL